MRVLHIWNDYSPTLFDQSHPACMERGIQSRLLAGHFIDNGAPLLANTFCFRSRTPEDLNATAVLVRAVRRLRRLGFWSRFGRFCMRHAEEFRPDLIHIHFGTTAAMLLPMLEATQVPVVVSLYGVDASAVLKDPKWLARYRRLFERASMLIVLCESVADRLAGFGCRRKKIRQYNLPAGIENYPFRQRRFDGTTRFLIAARFTEKKGHAVLLKAFREVIAKRQDVHLTVMGYGPSEWLALMIRDLRLESSTSLINNGLTADFVGLFNKTLAEHDVFLAPSTTAKDGDDEGGPALTMVAAQAAGLPVIATPFVGAELSLLDGETGIYCRQDDVQSLANCMLELCAQPAKWQELGEAGSRLVGREFSRTGQTDKLLQFYEEAAASAR
jgi:colanic acid/amylovoran biosynthesis glycosyltransferase